MKPSSPAAAPARSPYLPVLVLSIVLIGAGIYLAPRINMIGDVMCWAVWGRLSGGARPWDIYRLAHDTKVSVYPPLFLYYLTIVEALRQILHLHVWNPVSIVLFKLPSLLACTLGALLIRRDWGAEGADPDKERRTAWRAALCWVLCAPLFVNAALWGQIDALLGLGLILSLLALARGRWVRSGILLGLTVTLKVQALLLLPVAIVYVLRVGGWRSALRWLAAVALAILLVCLPMIAAGQIAGLVAVFEPVGFYNWRTMNAYNFWAIADYVGLNVLNLPGERVVYDTVPVLGPLTSRTIGLLAFGGVTAGLLVSLWRRADRSRLLLVSALLYFAFFLLNTEMHERYVLPAVAALACIAPESRRCLLLYIGVAFTSTLNQATVLYDNAHNLDVTQIAGSSQANASAAAAIGAINLILLLWGLTLLREPSGGTSDAAAAGVAKE